MMMCICIKQYLCNILSMIHEKVKGHWGWVEKMRVLHWRIFGNWSQLILNISWKVLPYSRDAKSNFCHSYKSAGEMIKGKLKTYITHKMEYFWLPFLALLSTSHTFLLNYLHPFPPPPCHSLKSAKLWNDTFSCLNKPCYAKVGGKGEKSQS